ncbi:single-stranded DNA-binding protein [Staphylococcus sp. 17KM0847]|uniref:single-stranded DNA-binding protein n=1 Tax=Staphylococcus sp. 17KM0847 TaxID=2583989 RepID=UPI0015DD1BFC|nr:single-stranded DNA-binding protein [Staphylococcus sp. 17KM0847]
MNQFKARGTVSQEPKYYEKPGSHFIAFSLAVERSFRSKDDRPIYDYLNCKAFGPVAIQVDQYVKKGDTICIEGYVTTRRFQYNDQKRFITEIVVESVNKDESSIIIPPEPIIV